MCYAISQIYYLMFNLGYNANWDGAFFKVATLMAFGNCMVNPVVYFFKYRDFQNALRLLMCCCFGEIDKGRYQLKKEKIDSSQQVSDNTCEIVSWQCCFDHASDFKIFKMELIYRGVFQEILNLSLKLRQLFICMFFTINTLLLSLCWSIYSAWMYPF